MMICNYVAFILNTYKFQVINAIELTLNHTDNIQIQSLAEIMFGHTLLTSDQAMI
jgi:hypothetical protein